jgi:hypothetical protein
MTGRIKALEAANEPPKPAGRRQRVLLYLEGTPAPRARPGDVVLQISEQEAQL